MDHKRAIIATAEFLKLAAETKKFIYGDLFMHFLRYLIQ
jgi:hypothetical protein